MFYLVGPARRIVRHEAAKLAEDDHVTCVLDVSS